MFSFKEVLSRGKLRRGKVTLRIRDIKKQDGELGNEVDSTCPVEY